jgi:8-oxo-dGTP pyrophosphatase MutT (NUDIX family)
MTLIPWKTIASRKIIQDKWIKLRADKCETAQGKIVDPYYVQESADWVHVVAFDAQDQILITRQYRHGAGIISVEIPCGVVEDGEDPADAMRRELLEETGCTIASLEPLGVLSPNPARYSNRLFPFVALGTRVEHQQNLDHSEDIEFEFVPINKVLSLIDSGSFKQALHIATILLALRNRGFLRADNPS